MKKKRSTWYKVPLMVLAALLAPAAHAQMTVTKVVNAASFVQNTSLTPGSIVSIFGTNLTNTTAQTTTADPAKLPTTLGGVTLKIAGLDCVLFYVSPTQINAQLNPGAPLGTPALTLTSPTGTFTAYPLIAAAGAPGLFTFNGAGTRDGAILNAVTFDQGPFTVTTNGQPTYLAIYATGLDLSAAPKVTIGGMDVPVQYYGAAPGFVGLQQINVQLPAALAGAGRVEVAVTAGGKTSNIVEVVILPSPGQTAFAPKQENEPRHRELAAIAWVPGKSLALLTDENDDVVRVLDLKQKIVVKTIALADGAEPAAVAVNDDGSFAVVAERNRAKVAVIGLNRDVSAFAVDFEVDVASGPSSVALIAHRAVVVSQDQDIVTVVDLDAKKALPAIAVGRGPRYVSVDGVQYGYVTNQTDGTISVIDVTNAKETTRLNLGDANARPFAIQLLRSLNVAVVTEPSNRKVLLVDLSNGKTLSSFDAATEKAGGLSDVAVFGATVYLANQTGGSVAVTSVAGTPLAFGSTSTIKVDIGARALAVDALDKLLLVTNEGSGTVVLVDLTSNQVAGRINGVRCECEAEDDDHDQRNDREHAANAPTITGLDPKSAKPGTANLTLTIAGTNLAGVQQVVFIDPASLPGKAQGRHENHGEDRGRGPAGQPDAAFTSSLVSATSTTVTVKIGIAANAAPGDRLVRVLSPNGESSRALSSANTFTVLKP